MSETYSVLGMTCGGCAKSVSNAILGRSPGAQVEVNLEQKSVTVDGADEASVKQAVEDAGFEYAGKA